MKRGFTLIEILAVIVLLTLLMGLAVPAIINSVNNKRDQISDISKEMIYDAAELYLSESGVDNLCITLEELVEDGKLVSPVKDLQNDKEIPLNYYVEVTKDENGQNSYEIKSTCSAYTVYNPGKDVYYNPVTNKKCTQSEALAKTSTCYMWRVISVNDSTSKNKITLQLDHNIVNLTAWVSKTDYNDDTNYGENGNTNKGPITALKVLEEATSGWHNDLKLTYSYNTSSATNNYGTLSCTNGACKVGNGSNITTNLKARMITGEEVSALTVAAGAASNSRAGTWTLSSGAYYYFSRDDYVLGTPTTKVSQGETGSTELKWLVENTYAHTNSKSTNNTYGSINYGYWTLSPSSGTSSGAWYVYHDGGLANSGDVSRLRSFGVRPVITLNKSIFE